MKADEKGRPGGPSPSGGRIGRWRGFTPRFRTLKLKGVPGVRTETRSPGLAAVGVNRKKSAANAPPANIPRREETMQGQRW
jgi:hypothetical protein